MSDTIPVGGYLDADLIMNQWNGGYNPGEVQFGTSIFNFIHPNGTVWESVSDGRGSVSGMEGTASGTTTYYRDAYLVFVGSDINRFSMGDFNDGMDFVIAYWDGDHWTYDNNSGYAEYRVFTPNDNDCIVAQLWRDTLAPPGIDDMETFFLPTENYDTGVVNYIPDPSFLTQTWQPPFPDPEAGVHNGYLEFSDEESLFGGYSLRHYTDGGSTYTNGQIFHPNPTNGLSEATSGQSWIFSAWCKTSATNLVRNSDAEDIANDSYTGNGEWVAALHPNAVQPNYWSPGFNGFGSGWAEGTAHLGKHAYWTNSTDLFAKHGVECHSGQYCMEMNDDNEQFSEATVGEENWDSSWTFDNLQGRWLGTSQTIVNTTGGLATTWSELGIEPGTELTVSWYQMVSDIVKPSRVGMYHRITDDCSREFGNALQSHYNSEPWVWERKSFSFTVGDNWVIDTSICSGGPQGLLYFYGHHGTNSVVEGTSIWYDDVQLDGIASSPIQLYIFGLDSNQEWISTQYIGDQSVGDCTAEWQQFSNEITFDSPDVSHVTVRVDFSHELVGRSVHWDALQLSPYTPPQSNAPMIQIEVN